MFVRSRNKQSRRSRWQSADASVMRNHNLSMTLYCVMREEPISRASIARKTGLARSTVTNIVGELLDAGLVSQTQTHESKGGRPPIALRVERSSLHLIGAELGATHLSVLISDLQGAVKGTAHRDYPVENDPEGALDTLAKMVNELRPGPSMGPCIGVGLAVPSPIDPARPGLLSDRILPAWSGVRPAEVLTKATGLRTQMENDANLGALAESWWGAGESLEDFAYIKLGTGVGGGLLIDGRIYRGATGIAGEIGHTAVRRDGPRCRCGLYGCLEASIGSQVLVQRAREALAAQNASRAEQLDLEGLVSGVTASEPWAIEIVRAAGHDLGVAVANLLNLLNPGAVVIGGKLAETGEHLLGPLRTAMAERSLVTSVENTVVAVSPLGRDAIALGAAALVLDHALDHPDILLHPEQLAS